MKIIIALLIFSLIILFHEFGHFSLAKACDVQVNEFCLGFGPDLIHFTKGETKYSIKLLWLGGACVMEGEDGDSTNPRAFNNKKAWQRFLIVFAGPFFNFILAFVAAFIVIMSIGAAKPVVSEVVEGSPAEAAGLEAGDEIVKMGNYRVHLFNEIPVYLYFNHDDITIKYSRDGQLYETTLDAVDDGSGSYKIGVVSSGYQKLGIFEALKYSVYEMKYQFYLTIESLKLLFTGSLSVNDMSGPVGLVDTIGDVYEESSADGAFYVFINMMNIVVLISTNLGIMNLLPLPALDGGRLLFIIVEMIRRKKIDEEIEGKVHMIGFVILMIFMLFIMYNDIARIFFR